MEPTGRFQTLQRDLYGFRLQGIAGLGLLMLCLGPLEVWGFTWRFMCSYKWVISRVTVDINHTTVSTYNPTFSCP